MKDLRKQMYIIVDAKNNGAATTLAYSKKDCISRFLKGSDVNWKQAKRIGWKCEKVMVDITSLSNDWF